MAGNWFSSWNPFGNVNQDTLNGVLDSQVGATGPSGAQTDWWDTLPNDGSNPDNYHRRIGSTLANKLGAMGYYSDERSQQNLGANVANLVNIARTKAAAEGNINGASNPDSVRNYLKQYLRQYLTTGNLAGATGVAGPGSTGGNYRDLYGQIAANANAAQAGNDTNATNWYTGNSFNLLNGLETIAGLQTGGGLRSSIGETMTNLRDRASSNNKRFWQDETGAAFNPWGGSFSSNLPAPPVQTPAAPVPPPVDPQPAATQPPPPPVPTFTETPSPSPNAPKPYAPNPYTPAPLMPPPPAPQLPTDDPGLLAGQQLGEAWTQIFGRQITGPEFQEWMGRLRNTFGGDMNAMLAGIRQSPYGRRYGETGVAAPVVRDENDREGARNYYNWLQPGEDIESWIDNLLRLQTGRINRY